jgi:hypothetical protein
VLTARATGGQPTPSSETSDVRSQSGSGRPSPPTAASPVREVTATRWLCFVMLLIFVGVVLGIASAGLAVFAAMCAAIRNDDKRG